MHSALTRRALLSAALATSTLVSRGPAFAADTNPLCALLASGHCPRSRRASTAVLTDRVIVTVAGPLDGLFADCPAADVCVSSQDDRPQAWDNPWIAEGATADEISRLRRYIEGKLGGRVVASDGERYLRVEFEDRAPIGGGTSIDDAEFFLAPNDTLVQFRSARRGGLPTDFGANRKRLEKARMALGYEKVPVLRNRRRALVVVEIPFDNFGPATYDVDELGFTARDLVPAEAKTGEMYRGDVDPRSSPWSPPSAAVKLWMRESDDRVRSK